MARKPVSRSKFVALLRGGAALAALSSLLELACPGTLEDPSRFDLDAGAVCDDVDSVERVLFPDRCGGSGCHGGAGQVAANLDLVAPGVRERVLDKRGVCSGILADPKDPEGSLLYTKVDGTSTCLQPMPIGRSPFNKRELACLRDWIASLGTGGAGGSDGSAGETAPSPATPSE